MRRRRKQHSHEPIASRRAEIPAGSPSASERIPGKFVSPGTYTLSGRIPVDVDVEVKNGAIVKVNQVRAFDSLFEWVPIEITLTAPVGVKIDEIETQLRLRHALEQADLTWPSWEWS